DSTGILVSGWGCTTVFDRQPQKERPDIRPHAAAHDLACILADLPWNLSSFTALRPNLLDIRRYAHANRPRLRLSVSIGVHESPNADRHVRSDPDLLLGGVCALSRAGSELRLSQRWRSTKLGTQLHRISFAFQQEFKFVVGVRRLVPESFPARASICFQRRRL